VNVLADFEGSTHRSNENGFNRLTWEITGEYLAKKEVDITNDKREKS